MTIDQAAQLSIQLDQVGGRQWQIECDGDRTRVSLDHPLLVDPLEIVVDDPATAVDACRGFARVWEALADALDECREREPDWDALAKDRRNGW